MGREVGDGVAGVKPRLRTASRSFTLRNSAGNAAARRSSAEEGSRMDARALVLALAGHWSFAKIDWSQGLSRDAFSQPEKVLEALAIEPGARVAIVEPRASWASWWLLLPPGHGVAVPAMRREMAEAGYRPLASHDFLAAHSFEVFAPAP